MNCKVLREPVGELPKHSTSFRDSRELPASCGVPEQYERNNRLGNSRASGINSGFAHEPVEAQIPKTLIVTPYFHEIRMRSSSRRNSRR